MKMWGTLNSLCKSSQCPGDFISTSRCKPLQACSCSGHREGMHSLSPCQLRNLLCKPHPSKSCIPRGQHSYAQKTCCLLSISTFHKFTININPDLENKLWTKANRLKNRFSLMRRFTLSFSPPTFLTWLSWKLQCIFPWWDPFHDCCNMVESISVLN